MGLTRHRRGAPALTGDPLAGVERVFIDGSNLVHALARGRALARGSAPEPPSAIVARLRAAFPPAVIVDLVFDGPAAGGIAGRLATGLRVAYSGRRSADQVIDDGIAAQLAADGPAGTWGILVVTDDRGLRDAVRSKGARTAGTAWLAGRIGRLAGPVGPREVEAPGHGPCGPGRGPGKPGRGPGRGRGPRAARPGAGLPLPKAGTTFGHRRPPRRAAPDED